MYGNPCRGCGFDWDLTPGRAVELVRNVPAVFTERLQGATGRERHPELEWTSSAYVSHVADNLRTWSERLTGAHTAGATEVPGYDPDLHPPSAWTLGGDHHLVTAARPDA